MPGVRCFANLGTRMKLTFISIALIFCSLAACEAAFAQPDAGDPYIVPSDSSGELVSREIDSMAVESRQSGERLFVIARLGAGEIQAA
jgi:hypothetical protein